MHVQQMGDIHVLRDKLDVPGLGFLPVNAFVIHGDAPVLVDSGLPGSREVFLDSLRSVLDLADLRWIWLTHADRDHLGSLLQVLDLAPNARLVSTSAAYGLLSLEHEIPEDRVALVNPGEALEVGGGRRLHAFRPPLYDSPMTVGFFDDGNGACFTSDCFGAVMPTLDSAVVDDLGDLDGDEVREGQLFWAGVDSPWVHVVDPKLFAGTYDGLRRFRPGRVLSAHLPPAENRIDEFLDFLDFVPKSASSDTPGHEVAEDLLERAITSHAQGS